VAERNSLGPSRYASMRTFAEPHFLWRLGAYDEIRLFGLIGCCNLRNGFTSAGRPSSHRAVTSRSEAHSGNCGHDALATSAPLLLSQDLHLLFLSFPALHHLSLSRSLRQLLAPMGVVERIVNLCCNPQAVQEHRELPRYGYHRSFLGILAAPRSYLLSVTP
jgi:hypothetical protein